MGADGVPREQAELAEMEVRAEGSRRGFSKLGGAPVRNGIPCLFREPRSCGKSFASLDAAQFRCAAEQSKKGYTRVETRKACLGAKSTRVVAHGAPGAKSQVASTLYEVQLLQHTWLLNGSTSKTGMMDIQMDSRMELESWT